MDAKGGRARVPISDPWPQTIANGGVSLIELVVVLTIIGVLSAIAIPSFLRYQLRSRTAESLLNLKSIATAQEIYMAEFGTYVSVSPAVPATSPGNGRTQWTWGSSFDVLGWSPEGGVQFQYRVTADGGGAGFTRFTAEARGDLDGDGEPSFWAFVKPDQNGGLGGSFVGTTCDGSGVVSGGSSNAIEAPGACDPSSGRSVF